ncbi:hypothetical protein LIER_34426 [Lithospermum erythrorhizon]|uniref:Uncharacterized protein n=1 Tax=Lithospermum erythrorhizon TaxID=34254 RepID=A0AAV3RZH1_LITER
MELGDKLKNGSEPQYDCLIFDVDDTLYPVSSGLSAEVTKNIIEYMINKLGIEESKVPEMCVQLYKDYGTTMAGLRAVGYDFDYDDYHSYVHGRLPYELLKPDHVLRNILQSLPIRKIIFSNGNDAHVAKVLNRLNLEGCFDDVISFETLNPIHNSSVSQNENVGEFQFNSIEHLLFVQRRVFAYTICDLYTDSKCPKSPVVCKPFEESFEQAFKIVKVNPQKALFFDDSIRNLQSGKRMGLHTVWVGASQRTEGVDYALESIHNIREALPELWEAVQKFAAVYSGEIPIETPVKA